MYCIECGAQITDKSKFCSHCGQKQTEGDSSLKEKIAEVSFGKEITRQEVEEHKDSIAYGFLKKSMGWYLAWILLHLGLLLIGSDGIFDGDNMGTSYFWPFGRGYYVNWNWHALEIEHYDITEFLVYAVFPLAILVIWSMVQANNTKNEKIQSES